MGRVGIAVVGVGGIAEHSHLPVIRELKDFFDLIAVCDSSEVRAREIGGKFHVPYYTDVDKVLRIDGVEVVDVCTPHYNHHIIGKMAAEAGKHIIVEKPLALTLACADIMIKACDKAGVWWEVAENYYRMPMERVKLMLIKGGIIGDVFRAYVIDPDDPPVSWRQVLELAGGGWCIDMGVHSASLIRSYVGSEGKSVVGLTKQFMPAEGKTVEDWGLAIIEFNNGSVGVLECSAAHPGGKIGYREVVGSKGSIMGNEVYMFKEGRRVKLEVVRDVQKVDGKEVLNKLIVKSEPPVLWDNPFKEYNLDDWHIGIADELMSIRNAVIHDTPPEYGIQGRRDLELIEALYESSLMGMKPINLPLKTPTSYEEKVHEAFKQRFGYSPLKV